jgi:hypothetical protein
MKWVICGDVEDYFSADLNEKKNSRRDDIFNVLTLCLKKKHLSWQNDDDFSIRSDGSSMVKKSLPDHDAPFSLERNGNVKMSWI